MVFCSGKLWSESYSVVSDSLWPHGLYSPWNSPGKNTGVGCHTFLQGSSQPRDQTLVSCIAGGFFTSWATREALVSCNSLYCEYLQFESTWFLLRSCSQPSFERSKFCFFRFFIILIVVRMEWQLLRGWKAKRKSCYNFFIIIPALVSSCQLEIQGFRLIFFLRFLKCVFPLNLFFFSIKEFFFSVEVRLIYNIILVSGV